MMNNMNIIKPNTLEIQIVTQQSDNNKTFDVNNIIIDTGSMTSEEIESWARMSTRMITDVSLIRATFSTSTWSMVYGCLRYGTEEPDVPAVPVVPAVPPPMMRINTSSNVWFVFPQDEQECLKTIKLYFEKTKMII
jgi:hypothetical protein